ncbi:alginate lyase family protein [Gordonia sp. VNQ95]|uniref:heparinase II/III family protein n=1 Tax=Gordonia sp. VNQ95 TaxID=3156619 RepID=UPI0032B351CE
MSRLSWYADRLRSMSPAEIGWRVVTTARSRSPLPTRPARLTAQEWGAAHAAFRAGHNRPILLDRARAQRIAREHPRDTAALIAAADDAVALRFGWFGYPTAQLATPVDWNHDPVADVTWPSIAASRIDHRTAGGDVKWIWELNRLQHLPWLAQAWLITGDDVYANAAFAQLDSWIAQNPPGTGIAWRGGFEAGVRAISVAIALQGLRESPQFTEDRFVAAAGILAASAQRCWAGRSLFSSANNHLIGEMAGLATVALILPDLPDAQRWERNAVRTLITHANRQILPDGSGAEQAVGYQIFTAELLLVVARLIALRDGTAPPALTDAIGRSTRFLAATVGTGDPAPRYGDDDEGFALRLDAEPTRTVRSHLAIVGRALGDRTLTRRGTESLTGAWLADPHAPHSETTVPDSFHAPDAGLVVLRSGRRRLTMDVGPLGFLSIAAHGHADALSITLADDGREIITDPGAGSYYGTPQRRTVHRGTRVHATVTVDGADQSVIGGPFLWNDHAAVRIRSVDLEAGIVDAEHDGYQRLSQPVTHRRWLIAAPDRPEIVVVDLLTGTGSHRATVSWPLAPSIHADTVAATDGDETGAAAATLTDPRDRQAGTHHLVTAATTPLRTEVHRGDPASHLGWWSERLEKAIPATLLGMSGHAELPIAMVSVLTPDEPVTELTIRQNTDLSEFPQENLVIDWRFHAQSHSLDIAIAKDGVVLGDTRGPGIRERAVGST